MVDLEALKWALARLDIESEPTKFGFRDFEHFAATSEEEIDRIASEKAFLSEAHANLLIHYFNRAPKTQK